MPRLNSILVKNLTDIKTPTYDRQATKAGIVHLGIGAFHRAHQAWYTNWVMNEMGGDWAIIACSLRSDTVYQQMAEQDFLYTVLERSTKDKAEIIGSVSQVLVGPQSPQAIMAAIAEPNIKIISLTVTEKGYCHNPATGQLNFEHPDIVHDLAHLNEPQSAIGYIVAGLRQRQENNLPGLTVMSCDNLPSNGQVTKRCVIQFAEAVSATLAQWIKENVTFPSTVIDRIVPATEESDIALLESRLGYRDEAMVVAEPFSQWIIEDNFACGRPEWERVGAQLVADAEIYELIKLRLLNGTHSLLAYTGYLAEKVAIADVMRDPVLKKVCTAFMRSAASTITPPEDFDIELYQKQLHERFANPGLKHRTWQIAMDGSQKIPQRWLSTLDDIIETNGDIRFFAFALAAWMKYISGTDEQGRAIKVSDPLADDFHLISSQYFTTLSEYVSRIFALKSIFSEKLISTKNLELFTIEYLREININGTLATVKKLLQ